MCRACETTCPSGVAYGRLLETGRNQLAQLQGRGHLDSAQRLMLRKILPYRKRFDLLLKLTAHWETL